jgi:L-fucose isomerase-like protein
VKDYSENNMDNMPKIKLGLIAVSRDCFPIELARTRLRALTEECRKRDLPVEVCATIVESERDALTAAADMTQRQINAACLYLGNFGPEGPLTICAKKLNVPCMLAGAAEESGAHLVQGRGDAFCGMLNASLNAGLRNLTLHLPARPVGSPAAVADAIADFLPAARVVNGLRRLKVFAFGPRPQDFYACNAPIKPLYNLGIEVMENSELDLYDLFRCAGERHSEIDAVARDMARELGAGNRHPQKLPALAQFELALQSFFADHLGACDYGVFANKCWPTFEKMFGFVPCYVNSRLAARGIPVACEVDIYGAVSEYMCQLASGQSVTILDINNTVPADLAPDADLKGAAREDLFMGFHCGNTPHERLCEGCGMKHQLIMNRLMESPDAPPDITCGTLEGTLRPGPCSLFRLQATPDGAGLMSYAADGFVLDADPCSFGGIGIVAVRDFARFYRHVLLERKFPHHAAMAFAQVGRILFDAAQLAGIGRVAAPRPAAHLYPTENPFA